jgi:hypothetical protein
MEIEGEPAKRFSVKHRFEIAEFDTEDEVRAFVKKRVDRKYQIYDRRTLVELKDLKD